MTDPAPSYAELRARRRNFREDQEDDRQELDRLFSEAERECLG